jgi:YHYH protein
MHAIKAQKNKHKGIRMIRLPAHFSILPVLLLTACGGDSSTPLADTAPANAQQTSANSQLSLCEPPTLALGNTALDLLQSTSSGSAGFTIGGLNSGSPTIEGLNLGGITVTGHSSDAPSATSPYSPRRSPQAKDGIGIDIHQPTVVINFEEIDAPTLNEIMSALILESFNQSEEGCLTSPVDSTQYVFLHSNGIPDHDVGSFPNDMNPYAMSAQQYSFRIILNPALAETHTALSTERFDAVLFNGVPVQMRESSCRSSCGLPSPSNPMHEPALYGMDSHNGHVLSSGNYHYHGDPKTLYDDITDQASPMIGVAADSFPVFGPWINDDGVIRKAQSSYQLKTGLRITSALSPSAPYDGSTVADYEYIAGSGDLDECNGMTVNGLYRYHVTDTFPYILNCLRGTPNASFNLLID